MEESLENWELNFQESGHFTQLAYKANIVHLQIDLQFFELLQGFIFNLVG